jgi:hypothetical protein
MDEADFEAELRRLNPGRDDIKVTWPAPGMPVVEFNNRLGQPKDPRMQRRAKPDGT